MEICGLTAVNLHIITHEFDGVSDSPEAPSRRLSFVVTITFNQPRFGFESFL